MTMVYKSEETALRIKMRAKVYGVPVGQMLDDLKLGRNTMSNMKTSRIKADSLARTICTVPWIIGAAARNARRSTEEKSPTPPIF